MVQVRDAEAWQLVDERLDEMRRLSYAELREWVGGDVEVEQLERSTGRFRRRTRVMTLYRDRRGIAPERPLGGNSAL